MKQDGIQYDPGTGKWEYVLSGKISKNQWHDREACAKAYVTAYLDKRPEHKALVTGTSNAAECTAFHDDAEHAR